MRTMYVAFLKTCDSEHIGSLSGVFHGRSLLASWLFQLEMLKTCQNTSIILYHYTSDQHLTEAFDACRTG